MPILSCCTKGGFYANLALLYSKANFNAGCLSIKAPSDEDDYNYY